MRKATETRKTKETNIQVEWDIDGGSPSKINTQIPFLDHMLELFAYHGYFNLNIQATGDREIDDHHTVEDLGIVMGTVFKKAIGDKAGINRYGFFMLPMDEALALISLDISNRPFLGYEVTITDPLQNFDHVLVKEFLSAFTLNAGITLHIKLLAGDNTHHILEAIFKGLGKSLRMAVAYSATEKGIPSTKGVI